MAGSTRTWFTGPLETVATWWRIERADGVTLGFTSHDRDLAFDGLTHRTAPGMVPSAIRRTATFEADSAEITGALSHDAISETDLAAGRFDGARIAMGLVDWETLETTTLHSGAIGTVGRESTGFSAELLSLKDQLNRDVVPRTAPTCRAAFCGEGCTLSAARFEHDATLIETAEGGDAIRIACAVPADALLFGGVRWIDGPNAGLRRHAIALDADWITLDQPVFTAMSEGGRLLVREGCDHTLQTCADRFGNAVNFQGEPFLPGNDLLTRYPPA